MKIKDFMISDVVTVTKETNIQELLETLVTNHIGGVPIVAEDHTLIDIISDGDIIRYLHPKSRTVYDMFSLVMVSEPEELEQKLASALGHRVEDIMRKRDIKSVHPEDPIEEGLDLLSKYRFKKIPVIDEQDKVVGVISRGDIIRVMSNKLIDLGNDQS